MVRSISVLIALLLIVLSVFSSAVSLLGEAAQTDSDPIIKLTDKEIIKNESKFYDNSTIYKLPSTVKDTDEISVIVQVRKDSLLDAYEAGDKSISFTDYASSPEAEEVNEKILDEKIALLSAVDENEINYELGADYKAVFGGFEMIIKAGDFEALCTQNVYN